MSVSEQKMSDLTTLLAEHASGRFENNINIAVPTLAGKILQEEEVDGKEWTRLCYGGSRQATTLAKDFGRRPVGGSIQPVEGRELPALITTTLAMGKAAALGKLNDDQVSSHLDSVLEEHSADCGRLMGRAIFGGGTNPYAAALWDGTGENATVSVPFEDISLFKPGAAYNFIDITAGKSFTVECTSITPGAIGANSENVAGTVVFTNNVKNPATNAVVALEDVDIAVGDSFELRGAALGFGGSTTVDGGLNSFDDMAGSGATANLHSIALANLPGWRGWYRDVDGAPYNQEGLASFLMFIQTMSGEMPTHVIMSPQLGVAHAAAGGLHGAVFGVPALSISAQRPQQLDRSMDKYGVFKEGYEDSGLRAAGKPVVLDPNIQATRAVAFNQKRTKLGVWQKMEPEAEGSNTVFLNRQTLSIEAFITGMYKMVTQKRSTIGVIEGYTGL